MQALAEAAWGPLASGLSSLQIAAALRTHRADLLAVRRRVEVQDLIGDAWPPGSWAAARALVQTDPRCRYMEAVPRSSLFGEIVCQTAHDALRQPRHADANTVARLINTFVTCFDGICDETPELLPWIVPSVQRLIEMFPDVPDVQPPRHPILDVTWGSARQATVLIARAGDHVGLQALKAGIGEAFEAQLCTLRDHDGDAVRSRSALSSSTFAVSLLVAGVFCRADIATLGRLLEASTPIGALFGWIDDVVDADEDARAGRPNMVLTVLASVSGSEAPSGGVSREGCDRVASESGERWLSLQRCLSDLGLHTPTVEERLRRAALAWLGFTDGVQAPRP